MLDTKTMIPDLNGDDFAFPLFRNLIFVNGRVNGASEAIFKFVTEHVKFSRYSCHLPVKRCFKLKKFTKKISQLLSSSFDQEWEGNQGYRLYGDECIDPDKGIGVPYISIEQLEYINYDIEDLDYMYFIEFAYDYDNNRSVQTGFENLLESLNICSGFSGYGFYVPLAYESIDDHIIPYLSRYQVALAQRPHRIPSGLKYDSFMKQWHPSAKPGIAGIGWKTFVGEEFFDRLDLDSLLTLKDQQIEVKQQEKSLVLTAGEQPVWGDIENDEDISAYVKVGHLLKSVRYPQELMPAIGDKYSLSEEEDYMNRLFG